jgi:hypothetical protein
MKPSPNLKIEPIGRRVVSLLIHGKGDCLQIHNGRTQLLLSAGRGKGPYAGI